MKRLYLLALLFLTTNLSNAQDWKTFEYQNGDILFQDLDCGALCDAIEAVTPGMNGKHFSHAGLVYLSADSIFVIEAIGKDVHSTPLDKFLQRQLDRAGYPKVIVSRLKKPFRKLNDRAVSFALKQTGIAYDDVFVYNNGKYYCTELIYDAYKAANKGKPFFKLYPMTYKDPGTDKTFPAWVDYYKELKAEIPEGKPGCNPGSIATSEKTEIIKSFY